MIPNTPRIRTSRNKQGSTSRFREVGMTRLPRKVGKVKEMTVASEWDDVLAAPVLREFAQKELQTRQAQLDESCGRIEALQAEKASLQALHEAALQAATQGHKAELGKANGAVVSMAKTLEEREAEIDRLRQSVNDLEATVKRLSPMSEAVK